MSGLQLWSELFDKSTVNIIQLDGGEFWFQVSHVCKLLGHTNPTVALQSHTDDDERQQLDIGKHELVNFVSESGLYGLILGSNKPQAKKFKRWLRRDVLPKLRASGGYLMPSATSEQIEALKAEHQALQKENLQLNQRVEDLEVSQNELIEASYSVFLLVMKIAPVLIEWSIDLIPSIRRGFEVKASKAYFQSITFRMTSGLQKLVDIDDYVRKLERLNFDRWDLQAETLQEKKSVFDSFLTQLAKLQR
jgi:prophage antirepressor-like protein